ncbi:anti-phage dCTP deaminase [Sphingomonas sp. 2378]|uniref:anti-phage dCTP deaminase n=1 Tax=Sphingomonas sp. 2378 TaxID=1219748 RepID=UPI00311B0993
MITKNKPELIIALAGPIGTDLHLLAETLSESLKAFDYQSQQIRVSSLITEWCDDELKSQISTAKFDRKARLLMGAGDAIRAQVGKGDALVPIIVGAIRTAREALPKPDGATANDVARPNTCFIIDSLKHPDEVETLKGIYGDNFVLISGFSSIKERRSSISSLIAKSNISTKDEDFLPTADSLIANDAKRYDGQIGQSLRDTFPLGDVFVRVSGEFMPKLERFLCLLFGSPYITPHHDEFFMFEAKAKSYQSADLSRQIGAVIINRQNHIAASGCNEVPVAGGGNYWPDMKGSIDNRDYKKGRDFNAVKKVEIIEEFVKFLDDNDVVTLPEGTSAEDVVKNLLFGSKKRLFKELRVSNLIEFGRVVHAEMNAISTAARLGIPIGGGTVFSTTYPCHMCARHIIAAGISRVVYIEPYPKSMTEELYGEIVAVDPEPLPAGEANHDAANSNVVMFEPFEGVAPSLYRELFQGGTRKDPQGYTVTWTKSTAIPKIARTSTAHLSLELAVAKAVEQLVDVRLEDVSQSAGGQGDGDNQVKNSGTNPA